jgi:hypothetical protein
MDAIVSALENSLKAVHRQGQQVAVQCRTPDGSEWLLKGASPTIKHQGPLWHEDRPLSFGMQAVEDDPERSYALRYSPPDSRPSGAETSRKSVPSRSPFNC